MPEKKYVVRDGFVVVQAVKKADGNGTYDRVTAGGENITLNDADYALHAHKLELASQDDRDAALEAEQKAQVRRLAANTTPEVLMQNLVGALSHVLDNSAAAAQADTAAA